MGDCTGGTPTPSTSMRSAVLGYFDGWAVGPKGTIARMTNPKLYRKD